MELKDNKPVKWKVIAIPDILKTSKLNTSITDKAQLEAIDFFLARVSHDIRNSMNEILGLVHLLKDTIHEEGKKECDIIEKSGNHIVTLMNTILDISKLKSGEIALEIQETSIERIANYIKEQYHGSLEQKNITFLTNTPVHNKNIHIKCDKNKVLRILSNLMSNAIKFTPNGGQIILQIKTFDLTVDKGIYEFSIKNSGKGIPKKQLKYVFDPYKQVENKPVHGVGLGLSIVTELLSLMDSKCEVFSEVDKETEFKFQLKLDRCDINVSPMIVTRTIKYNKNIKIMVVEDNKVNQKIIKMFMKKLKIKKEIIQCYNGQEALDKLKEINYEIDIIFMDINMPIMDGITTTANIEKLNKGIPIIILSGECDKRIKNNCLLAGAVDFVDKPFKLTEIKRVLSEYIE